MILTDANIIKDLQAGILTHAELAKHLLNSFPATALANELAEYILVEKAKKPIVITKDQFETHFRIQGWKFQDGQWVQETRGKYSKKD